ncbi:MAG: TIGR03936 family radical SAM-associated protein [Oscillospiraceae bacterium]|nr:TIGR03936 family radical SAM-associated protein [Oscillospiraceae bacterium]MCL2279327.1 TIGR03936 family radical SAM-associated protein [Oscillospiraceae bacterium]
MSKIRCLYSKTGRAKFISHLDLMATFKRSFLRAGVKLTYSEGFNPHPYISVALPLSVGCESVCELIDVGFSGKEFPRHINDFLPDGLSILEVYPPGRKFSHIKWVKVSFSVRYGENTSKYKDEKKGSAENTEFIAESLKELFASESLVIPKKTKSGVSEVDIMPHVNCEHIRILSDFDIEICAVISAQNPTVSHNDFLSIIGMNRKIQTPNHFLLKRIEIYDADMIEFR